MANINIMVLGDDNMRRTLAGHHYMRAWLCYTAASLRYYNRHNMNAIGISEEKVMEYTDQRELRIKNEDDAPDQLDFYTDPIAPENLTTFAPLDALLDSLMGR